MSATLYFTLRPLTPSPGEGWYETGRRRLPCLEEDALCWHIILLDDAAQSLYDDPNLIRNYMARQPLAL